MDPLFLYFFGIICAWLFLEFLTRTGSMVSSNAALMLSLGVMMIVVGVVDWILNGPMINARTGKNITLDDYFEVNAVIVFLCFSSSAVFEVRKRRNRRK